MTKITPAQHEQAYQLGKDVFARRLSISKAKERMRATAINLNSATDLIYNVGHMLRGECYRRRMSLPATSSYYAWIERDFGTESALSAVQATEKHLEYYESISHGNLHPSDWRPGQGALRALVASVRQKLRNQTTDFLSAGEIPPEALLMEGATKTILVDVYERNPRARRECIAEFGAICAICCFDFAARYGQIGHGFIHVHHLREIASVGEAYAVNPKTDLRPVCPNCHAMLHKRSPAFGIDELRAMLRS
jgi:5-methylcytosine-specific restriction enzyme A